MLLAVRVSQILSFRERQRTENWNYSSRVLDVCRDVCQTCSGGEAITCLVNPLAGREAELDLAEQRKKLSLSAEDREVYMRHMYVRF